MMRAQCRRRVQPEPHDPRSVQKSERPQAHPLLCVTGNTKSPQRHAKMQWSGHTIHTAARRPWSGTSLITKGNSQPHDA